MVLNAMGRKTTQSDFFTAETSQVRSRIQVTLGGMSLADLDGLLSAHQVDTGFTHGDTISLDEFRYPMEKEDDVTLVVIKVEP